MIRAKRVLISDKRELRGAVNARVELMYVLYMHHFLAKLKLFKQPPRLCCGRTPRPRQRSDPQPFPNGLNQFFDLLLFAGGRNDGPEASIVPALHTFATPTFLP